MLKRGYKLMSEEQGSFAFCVVCSWRYRQCHAPLGPDDGSNLSEHALPHKRPRHSVCSRTTGSPSDLDQASGSTSISWALVGRVSPSGMSASPKQSISFKAS
jgi:hypothetical protein